MGPLRPSEPQLGALPNGDHAGLSSGFLILRLADRNHRGKRERTAQTTS
jgi:hypothetical protein